MRRWTRRNLFGEPGTPEGQRQLSPKLKVGRPLWVVLFFAVGLAIGPGCESDVDCTKTATCACTFDLDCDFVDMGECEVPACVAGVRGPVLAPQGTPCSGGACDALSLGSPRG